MDTSDRDDQQLNGNSDNNASNAASRTPAERSTTASDKPRRPRGFAAMDPKLVSELATRGGKAAHRAGTAHQFTSEEARVAGRKGGMATHAKRRAKLASDVQH
jgi:general stress protein YciG